MDTLRHTPTDLTAARALLSSSLVWDNHGCMPVARPHDTSFLPQLQRYRAAGVDMATINIGFGDQSIEDHLRTLASMRHWLLAQRADYLLVETADDVERARAEGRLGVSFDIEGVNAIGDQTSLIELYHALGVRWMLLAYNRNNRAGGGCQDDDGGLTPFGRQVIAEMERVGMVLCLSHTGHRTAREAIAVATRPLLFSHSNPSAVHAHPRNIPDDLIRACAATGGVVGINGVGSFLGQVDGRDDISSATFARHVDHVVQLVGPRHVSIALDYVFDLGEIETFLAKMQQTFPPELGYSTKPAFVAPEQLPEIVQALLDRGYREEDLRDILGGNLMRLARTVWKAPARG
ncbi:MAG: dipeptidase [Proteobacteria bacterium]|nr:dipeptidase [Pseudomonadota bacterium]